jgi:hypothetical protein
MIRMLLWAIALLSPGLAAGQPTSATLCELQARPAAFVQRIVTVRAVVVGRSPITIFDFDSPGCTGQLRVDVPTSKGLSGVQLKRDDSFARLEKALRERARITATFTGLFEYATKGRQSKMRIVLQNVSGVDVQRAPSVDR